MLFDRLILIDLIFFLSAGLASVRVVDIQGPVFVQEPPDVVEFSNSTGCAIVCAVKGTPQPSVDWHLANGDLLTTYTGLREVHPNGTLIFFPFRPEEYRQDIHSVVYKCRASNAVGSIISRNVHVVAVVKQYYEVHVYDEFVINGNTAVIKCHIPSFVRDYVTVTAWIKEGSEQLVIQSGGRYSVFASGELHIRNVKESDGKHMAYRCRTQHRLSREIKLSSSAGRLIVTDPRSSVPPRIIHSRNLVSAREGDSMEMPCAAQGYPLPTYTWKKLAGSNFVRVVVDGHMHLSSGSLFIKDVKIMDAGTYLCVVNNTVGEEKLETELKVTAPVSAFIEPLKQIIDVGKAASFRCTFSGFPISGVQWVKDGRPLLNSHRLRFPSTDTLQIFSVQREDKGMYQCFVTTLTTGHKMVQAAAELSLGDALPVMLKRFDSAILHPGSSLTLTCVASGNPPPQMRWSLNGVAVKTSDRLILEQKITVHGDIISHFNISSVRVEDSGDYQCTAVNRVGQTEHKQRIDVYGTPFVRSMPNVSVISGITCELQCPVAGYPIRSITWEREGVILPINHRQKVLPNGTLLVHNMQRSSDAGAYKCVVEGDEPNKMAFGIVYVAVMNAPKISPFTFSKDIQEAMRASVTCSVYHGDSPISISWMKDGVEIFSTTDLLVRNMDDMTSTLTIQHTKPRHTGNYTCVASNLDAVVNYTAQLLVLVPPHWTAEPNDATVIIGQSITIDCQADGEPFPFITWKKALIGRITGDYLPIEYSSGRNYMFPNGSLLLTNIQESDAGSYLCQANNNVGAGLSKLIFLKINAPPHFEEKFKNHTAKLNHKAILTCESKGDLPLLIQWKYENMVLNSSNPKYSISSRSAAKSLSSTLEIASVRKNDSGEYFCVASNAFGKDEAWIYLYVQEPPGIPIDVKLTVLKSRSLRVNWQKPFDGNSAIQNYIIQIKSVNKEGISDNRNVSVTGSEVSATIPDLKPSLQYKISAAAENSIGISFFSSVMLVTMAEEVPDGSPLNITVTPIDTSSLKIQWMPPRRDAWNGELIGYKIGYRVADTSDAFLFKSVNIKPISPEHYILRNLTRFTNYGIVIQVLNRVGPGPFSQEILASTLEDVPSQSPRNIKCVALTSQKLQISWSAPPVYSLNGILRGYRVIFKAISESIEKENFEFRSTTATEIVLQNLLKYTNYSIQLQAFNGAGDGVKSAIISCQTKEDVPEAPADIKVLPMSSDAIIISWRAPLHPNGVITKFTVYMQILGKDQKFPTSFTLSPTQFYYESRSLNENFQYKFWVTASTSIGEGPKSTIILSSPVSIVSAKIASFSQTLIAIRNENVVLPCRSVGIPTPDRDWTFMNRTIKETAKYQPLSDGSLLLFNYQPIDAGNYTCKIQNIYAHDEITHVVINKVNFRNKVLPQSASLQLSSKTHSSVSLIWKLNNLDHSVITGISINYKKNVDDWIEIQLEPSIRAFTLEQLSCGTEYHIYIVVYNQYGGSEPSDVVSTYTDGKAPEIPVESTIFEVNNTFVILNLLSWPDGGCPMLHFSIDYKEKDASQWQVVANQVPPMQSIVVTDLVPGTRYRIMIKAVNGAGLTIGEYDFVTLNESFGAKETLENSQLQMSFVFDLQILIPVLCGIAIVIILLILVISFFKHRYLNGYQSTSKSNIEIASLPKETSQNMINSSVCDNEGESCSPPVKRSFRNSDGGSKCSPIDGKEEINPYATFQLPSNRFIDSSEVHFHSFGYDEQSSADYPSLHPYTKVQKKVIEHRCGNTSPLREGIPLNFRRSTSKEHLSYLRTSTLIKLKSSCPDLYQIIQDSAIPSAPPAEAESSLEMNEFCFNGPDIAPTALRKGTQNLNYVPDILDHQLDSSSGSSASENSLRETDLIEMNHPLSNRKSSSSHPYKVVKTLLSPMDDQFSPENDVDSTTFTYHHRHGKSHFFYSDVNDREISPVFISQSSSNKTQKAQYGLAAEEEALILLLRSSEHVTLNTEPCKDDKIDV